MIWPILSLKHANARYLALSTALIILVILTFLRFLAFSPASSSIFLVPNTVNAGILCFMAILTMMTVSTLGKGRVNVVNYDFTLSALKWYIIFKSILAAVFLLSPPSYFRVRSFWTLSGNTIEVGDLSIITRFTGTLSDPNNFACIMVAVVAFVIFRQPYKMMQNVGILLLSSISIVASMSVTAICAFLIIVAIYATFARLSARRGTRLLLRFALVSVIPIIFFAAFQVFKDNLVVQLALQRVTESSTDSRLAKFAILADFDKLLPALFIGEGATIIWNGGIFQPHIGHIYLIFGYGVPAYILFLLAFFPVSLRKPLVNAAFLLPIFLGFSLNVGIYEPRFGGIWALLVGLYFIEPHGRNLVTRQDHDARSPYARIVKWPV